MRSDDPRYVAVIAKLDQRREALDEMLRGREPSTLLNFLTSLLERGDIAGGGAMQLDEHDPFRGTLLETAVTFEAAAHYIALTMEGGAA